MEMGEASQLAPFSGALHELGHSRAERLNLLVENAAGRVRGQQHQSVGPRALIQEEADQCTDPLAEIGRAHDRNSSHLCAPRMPASAWIQKKKDSKATGKK